MIYVHEELLEAIANEIAALVEEKLVAATTVCHDTSDVPCEGNDVVKAAGTPLSMNDGIYCVCNLTEKTLQGTLADLVTIFIQPMAIAVARGIDQVLLEQAYKKLVASGKVHRFPKPTRETSYKIIRDARQKLNENAVPTNQRHLIMTSNLETILLLSDAFRIANEGHEQGKIFGFNTWLNYTLVDMLWHREALILVSRPTFTFEKLSTVITLPSNICLRVTLALKKGSQDYILRVETHLGVIASIPEFATILGEIL